VCFAADLLLALRALIVLGVVSGRQQTTTP
jgi:hypothetical protein